jgi:hypothetical protein
VSLIREGNADLDEYKGSLDINRGAVIEVGGHTRNFFPMGSTLLAVGPMWLADVFVRTAAAVTPDACTATARVWQNWRVNFERTQSIDASWFYTVEMVLASLFMGLASAFIFSVAREHLTNTWALALTAVFAFGSAVFSTATRDLGQHGPSVLMLTLALWCLVKGERESRLVPWAGLFLGLSYVMRPTNSISVVILSLLVACKYRKSFLAFCAMGLLVAAAFFAYNLETYGQVFAPYYRPERTVPASLALWQEALVGNLISPARGLFVFSPIFIASVFGLVLALRSAQLRVVSVALALIITLHWLTVSGFPHWWAGYSFGPRYLTDMTPYLVFLLIPVAQWLSTRQRTRSLMAVGVLLATAAALSVFIHARGATSWPVADWNGSPLDVDQHPERLWDWTDLQFLRGLGKQP